MLLLQIYVMAVLVAVFWEDLQKRAVHWSLIAQVGICLAVIGLLSEGRHALVRESMLNLAFLALLLISVTIYVSIRERRLVNLLGVWMGPGDLLFFLACVPGFAHTEFIPFFVSGMLFCLLAYAVLIVLHRKAQRTVPTAGFMALYLVGWIGLHIAGITPSMAGWSSLIEP